MTKKKKIIFSSIAAALLIAIVVCLIFCLNKDKLTIDDLFDKNISYFESLESVNIEMVLDINNRQEVENGVHDYNMENTVNLITHYPTNTSFIQEIANGCINEQKSTFQTTMYKINQENETMIIYNDSVGLTDKNWYNTKTDERLESLMIAHDFQILVPFINSFKLEKDTVEINGTSCYKATARLYKPTTFVSYYDMEDLFGVCLYEFMRDYVDVVIYFNAETQIVHSIEYDFTDYQHAVFKSNNRRELLAGHFYLTISFKEFNTSSEIKVSDEISSNIKEYHGDYISDPIEIDDQYYEVSGTMPLRLGHQLKEYVDVYTDTQIIHFGTTSNTIEPNVAVLVEAKDEQGNTIFVEVKNISDVPVDYLECYIQKIEIYASDFANFYELGFGSNLKMSDSLQTFKSVLGRWTREYDTGNALGYRWQCYDDHSEIVIEINKTSSKIDKIQLYAWFVDLVVNEKINHIES